MGRPGQPVDNALGSRLTETAFEIDRTLADAYVDKVQTGAQTKSVVAIVNSKADYGGNWAVEDFAFVQRYNDDVMTINTLYHEFGHSFGWLADEYVTLPDRGPTAQDNASAQRMQAMGHNLNVSLTDDRAKVPWAHFIGHPNYTYVGVYEGAEYLGKGRWRSEEILIMGGGIIEVDYMKVLYFNAISREMIVKRILKMAGETYSFDDFVSKDKYEPN